MDTTIIEQSGFKWAIRVPKAYQDEHVVFEVVACDPYHLRDLALNIQPKVILDVGGHIGTFGVLAKSLWPNAFLIVVEPSYANLELYRQNVRLNKLTNVKFIRAAVSYDSEATCLVRSPNTTGGYVLRRYDDAQDYMKRNYRFYNKIDDFTTPLVTIEELLQDIDVVDLAKWDCEGGEVEAFKYMSDEVAKKFRFMVGEYHIWNENTDYLRPSLFDCIQFWRKVRRKFSHLYFNYTDKPLGNFQAWPREINRKVV